MKSDRRYKFKVSFATQTILIPLTQGQFAIIDAQDAERVLKYQWFAHRHHKLGRTFYALTNVRKEDGRRSKLQMHQLLLSSLPHQEVDHIDRDGLNNRRSNLRLSTKSQNGANSQAQVNNTSGYTGVSWKKQRHKWCAQIKVNGEQKHLGVFVDREAAAKAYDEAAVKFFGEFAVKNGTQANKTRELSSSP